MLGKEVRARNRYLRIILMEVKTTTESTREDKKRERG